MRLRLKETYEGQAPGTVLVLSDDKGRQLLAAGVAEEVRNEEPAAAREPKAAPGAGEGEPTMRVRFRHGHTLAGKAYTAGTAAVVPQSDEAWDAVDKGHCDLEPPPGVGGQPQVPERLARSEATEAPAPQTLQAGPAASARLTPTPPTPETIGGNPHTPPPKGRNQR
jgi:uncharacterized membrane protein